MAILRTRWGGGYYWGCRLTVTWNREKYIVIWMQKLIFFLLHFWNVKKKCVFVISKMPKIDFSPLSLIFFFGILTHCSTLYSWCCCWSFHGSFPRPQWGWGQSRGLDKISSSSPSLLPSSWKIKEGRYYYIDNFGSNQRAKEKFCVHLLSLSLKCNITMHVIQKQKLQLQLHT